MRSRSPLGFEYEAQVQIIKQKHGDLEAIRHRLGLSKRKISQILMVDPSAWTRWTKKGEDAPAHVYRSLEWYLLLQEKYPGMDSPFWLEAISRPARDSQRANLDFEKLQARLTQQIDAIQKRLRWTQVGLLSTILLAGFVIALISCVGPQKTSVFTPNSKLSEVALPGIEEKNLAERFAPIFMQEMGTDDKADLFGPVDYDHDWVSDNNWMNLDKFEFNPMSYYEVVSTSTHYFITYALFHPRDYSWVCLPIVCHENDMEGVLVVVDRATMKWTYSESIAHNYVYSQENTGQERPTLIVEWGGHGIYPPSQYKTDRLTKVYNPQIYTLEPIAKLWNLQFKEDKLFDSTFDYEGERFRLAGVPMAFRGRKWTDNRANAPWSWPDNAQGKRGDFFLDPALYISRKHPGTRMSLDYERNPYVSKQ